MQLYNVISIDEVKFNELKYSLNFLFVVHNDIEHQQMFDKLLPLDGYNAILKFIDSESKATFYIGKFCLHNIVLLKTSDMGSVDVGSSINMLNKAITILKPVFVVMVGIAAGLADNVNIGDVVIANKVMGYETEKRKLAEIIGRYPAYKSYRMNNLFDGIVINSFNKELNTEITAIVNDEAYNANKWGEFDSDLKEIFVKLQKEYGAMTTHKGTMITGEKLLDDPVFRCELKINHKEALALDMEGLGIATASISNKIYDWIVVKGISDLGDGSKGNNKQDCQTYAMNNAIRVVAEIFSDKFAFSNDDFKIEYYKEKLKKVMLSSSIVEEVKEFDKATLAKLFIAKLSMALIENNCEIYSGLGMGIGDAVITGIRYAFTKLHIDLGERENYYKIFPFARALEIEKLLGGFNYEKCKIETRDSLCANPRVFVFAFGSKSDGNNNIGLADGMYEELELAVKNKALIIPISATKCTAGEIYDNTIKNVDKYYKPYFEEKMKFRGLESTAEDLMNDYILALKELDITLTFENVDHIINKVVALIKNYG